MKNNVFYYWMEAEDPAMPQAPNTDPNAPGGVGAVPPQQNQATPQTGNDPSAAAEDDVTQDPQTIDAPPEDENKDYDQWRHQFMELAVRAENEELINMLTSVQDNEMEASERKFVEDNLQIFMYRRDSNVLKASNVIRNAIKKDLDRTNPGTTLMQHLGKALDEQPLLYQNLIKLSGTFAWKGDLHRKWIAAFLGAIQIGGGATGKDLIYCGDEYEINISTRLVTQFGEINIGKWSLVEDDPKKYLKADERENLSEGAPEEKQVLRRKIILKSIAENYRKRAFMIHICTTDGTIYALGWDLGNSLLDAYKEGKVVVRGQENEEKEILISDKGEIIPVIDYSILFVKETGEVDDNGKPETQEVPFLERRDSTLYLVADLDTLKMASAGMSGMFFTSVPYNGNPSDIRKLQQSVPGLSEILSKQVV